MPKKQSSTLEGESNQCLFFCCIWILFFCLGKCFAQDILCDCNIKLSRPITHPNTYSINLLNILVFGMKFCFIVNYGNFMFQIQFILNIAKTWKSKKITQQNHYTWCKYVAKYIRCFIFSLSIFNIQIWVNWFMDDCHLRYITKLKILVPQFYGIWYIHFSFILIKSKQNIIIVINLINQHFFIKYVWKTHKHDEAIGR